MRPASGGGQPSYLDLVEAAAVFADQDLVCRAHAFRGGALTAVGATLRLDLTGAELAPAGATIDARCFGAQIVVVVPEHWAVELAGATVAGNWQLAPAGASASPPLTLTGLALAGEVTLQRSSLRRSWD